jgi:hypothetical protein
MFCVSSVMSEEHVDHAVTALHESLTELRPFIEQERPELLVRA